MLPYAGELDSEKIHVQAPTAVVFLCGGQTSDIGDANPKSLRDAFLKIADNPAIRGRRIVQAEDINASDVLAQYDDFLQFETELAQITELILLFCESEGSFTELGAFSMLEEIASRLLVIIRDKYWNQDSFIKHGPLRYLEKKHGEEAVYVIDDNDIGVRGRSTADINVDDLKTFHRPKGSSVLRLAIGAPSSPCLSNILMRSFDIKVFEAVSSEQVTYSRYADDLTFSAKRTGYLTRVERMLRQIIHTTKSPSLRLNEAKTVLATKKYKRMVTGLILSNDGNVSIGHERKRLISATLHHASQGRLTTEELMKLSGMLAFVQDVEPDFFHRLKIKYGSHLIDRVRAIRKNSPNLLD